MVNGNRLVKLFLDLVHIDSPSGNEGQLRDFLINLWQERGFTTVEDQAGQRLGGDCGNLLIRVPGTVDGPAILLCAHMDTVEPGRGIKAKACEDGWIISSGETILGSDDKAALAAIIEAYDCSVENQTPRPRLELLFTVSEEQGLLGIKEFDFSMLEAELAYVIDDGHEPGSIVVQSPCQNEIIYTAHGLAAHAGMCPERGVNAIQAAARALAHMPSGRIDEDTTCNFGVIEGGMARNIVPDYCRVKGEARSLIPDRLDTLTRELKEAFIAEVEKAGAQAEVEVNLLYPAVTIAESDPVFVMAKTAAQKAGLNCQPVKTGGGSDASIINAHGIPCANLAIGMQEVHSRQEKIRIQDLNSVVEWLLALFEEAAQNQDLKP